mmetsp:Transcript_95257/g.213360  ORF Transcript_95257/g.213360 Transcript_95257/m.213360 type:complete len:206 (-) Transcript_95257:199-816(-)
MGWAMGIPPVATGEAIWMPDICGSGAPVATGAAAARGSATGGGASARTRAWASVSTASFLAFLTFLSVLDFFFLPPPHIMRITPAATPTTMSAMSSMAHHGRPLPPLVSPPISPPGTIVPLVVFASVLMGAMVGMPVGSTGAMVTTTAVLFGATVVSDRQRTDPETVSLGLVSPGERSAGTSVAYDPNFRQLLARRFFDGTLTAL